MEQQKLAYPKSLVFVLVHQIFERFSFWGIVAIYHGFTIFAYISSFVGAIVADAYWGKFRTIIGFSLIYFVGTFCLSTSATPLLSTNLQLTMAIVGLVLTALAAGSIKPCIIAHGGDQFKLPEQKKQLDDYFPMLSLVINFSLFFTAIFTPILRKDVSCFGDRTCYSLALFVPFAFVILAFVIFLAGKARYTNSKVKDNVVGKCLSCIKLAVVQRFKSSDTKNHWLDHAESRFEKDFIQDVKTVLRLLVLFLPVTFFWALFDQQFSRWIFQATRMNDKIFGYAVKPDQFATLNFVLTFIFIPVFEKILFPLLSKINLLKKPMQKVVTGALFASLAFVICGCLELQIEGSVKPLLTRIESHLNVINASPCILNINIDDGTSWPNVSKIIFPKNNFVFEKIPSGTILVQIQTELDLNSRVGSCKNITSHISQVDLLNGKAHSLLVYSNSDAIEAVFTKEPDDLSESLESNSKLRVIYAGLDTQSSPEGGTISLKSHDNPPAYKIKLRTTEGASEIEEITPKTYKIKFQNHNRSDDLGSIELLVGGSYVLAIGALKSSEIDHQAPEYYFANLYTITEPNSVHIIWLLPQYIVMSVAEVMVEISLTAVAYSQAPESMIKSLLQVVNLIPPALGGVVVVVFAEIKIFDAQSKEFFAFAGINFMAFLVLAFLAKKYKPIETLREEGLNNSSRNKSDKTMTTNLVKFLTCFSVELIESLLIIIYSSKCAG